MGSGSTAVAALRTGRHFVGYDTDEGYVATARRRVDDEHGRLRASRPGATAAPPAGGPQARDEARRLLAECGFVDVGGERRLPGGVSVDITARDQLGDPWYFQVSGGFTTVPTGLRRAETLWTAIGRATVVRAAEPKVPLVLLATDTPPRGSEGAAALDAIRPDVVFDVIPLLDPAGHARLRRYAAGAGPVDGQPDFP
jgi:hypothetical protein